MIALGEAFAWFSPRYSAMKFPHTTHEPTFDIESLQKMGSLVPLIKYSEVFVLWLEMLNIFIDSNSESFENWKLLNDLSTIPLD